MISKSISRLVLGALCFTALASVFTAASASSAPKPFVLLEDGIQIRLTRVNEAMSVQDLWRDNELTSVCGQIEAAHAAGIDVADVATLVDLLDDSFDTVVVDSEPYYVWRLIDGEWLMECKNPAGITLDPDAPNPIHISISDEIVFP